MLDYQNMNQIPTYGLFGETDSAAQSWLHWETITARSKLYGFSISAHRHDQLFQLLFLAKDKAEVMIDGETQTVSPPALIILPPLTVHGFIFSPDVEGIVLTLYERDVRELLSDMPEVAARIMQPQILYPPNEPGVGGALDNAVRRIVEEADGSEPGQVMALRARVMLLLVAAYRYSIAAETQSDARKDRAARHGSTFQRLVDSQYRDTRRIEDYATALGITPTHLNRVCRQIFGVSALTVIERRVLLEARRYLQFSSLSIKEIGILLGYPDPAYFSRFFSQRVGVSPQEFKSKNAG